MNRVKCGHFTLLLRSAMCPCLALGEFLLFFAVQARVALFKAPPRVIAFGGARLLLFKAERQSSDNR